MNIENTALEFAEWISKQGIFKDKDGAWHKGTNTYYEIVAKNTEELFKIYKDEKTN
jgi:hypothetical protein